MSYTKVLNIPDEQNVYFIGDIHGNFDLYERTLKEFGITNNDVVISVGDIVDRGERNARCLFEFLVTPNRHMVIGNHENMMMLAYNNTTNREWYHTWLYNGGQQTLNEIGFAGIQHFNELLKDVPYVIEVNHRGKKIGVAHAGIPRYPAITTWESIIDCTENSEQYRHDLLWDRDAIQYARYDFEVPELDKLLPVIDGVDYIIHGHTGVPNKFEFGNRIWIDTQFQSGEMTLAYLNDEGTMDYLRREKDEYSFMYKGR